MTSRVQLRTIRKRFGSVTALNGLELTIEGGEFVSLLGPSGCGKTTTLRIVAGFETADSGAVLVNGRNITHVPPSKRDMGMVFQSYSLFPNMTAVENVEFGLRVRRTAAARRRARAGELLDLVGLASQANQYPHQLSGGQQQRVALARALAVAPKVLLLDEPLSALDANVRITLREEIRRIQSDLGITTLFVTHNQEEALAISDRVGVMSREGALEQLAPPSTIYREPGTAFVAEFIGASNVLPGVVDDSGVIVHGQRIPAASAANHRKGQRITVIFRPEEIRITGVGTDRASRDLTGVVITRSFLGPVTRLSIRLQHGDGVVVRADVPSPQADDYPTGTIVSMHLTPVNPVLVPG